MRFSVLSLLQILVLSVRNIFNVFQDWVDNVNKPDMVLKDSNGETGTKQDDCLHPVRSAKTIVDGGGKNTVRSKK